MTGKINTRSKKLTETEILMMEMQKTNTKLLIENARLGMKLSIACFVSILLSILSMFVSMLLVIDHNYNPDYEMECTVEFEKMFPEFEKVVIGDTLYTIPGKCREE